jgi:hypothetical protein
MAQKYMNFIKIIEKRFTSEGTKQAQTRHKKNGIKKARNRAAQMFLVGEKGKNSAQNGTKTAQKGHKMSTSKTCTK